MFYSPLGLANPAIIRVSEQQYRDDDREDSCISVEDNEMQPRRRILGNYVFNGLLVCVYSRRGRDGGIMRQRVCIKEFATRNMIGFIQGLHYSFG